MEHFQKIELRRTRDFGEKFNATFEFIRQNYKGFMPAVIYFSVPLIVIGMVILSYYTNFTLYQDAGTYGAKGNVFGMMGNFFGYALIAYVFIIAGYLINTSLVYNYMKMYLSHDNPTTITPGELWDRSKKDIGNIFISSLLVGLVVVIGVLFLVIPGIYMGITLSLIIPIIIFEQKSVGDAFGRCFYLIKDKWWSTFGLLFVAGLLQGAMGFIFNIPEVILSVIFTINRTSSDFLSDPPLWQKGALIISSCIKAIGTGLLACISFIAIAFQYFNLVERREASGLMNQIEGFGSTPTSTQQDPKETY
ncbi:MAG TPA: hypothetical protein VFW11_02645 [Cyclobacteriaceae bacterium]|nr:hypothetical protein [Cyclobacteriaceae bacterium]